MTFDFRFTSKLTAKILGNGADKVLNGLTDALVGFDPATATDAAVEILREKIEAFSTRYIDAEHKVADENTKITNLKAAITKNISALTILKEKVTALAETDPKRAILIDQAHQLNDTIDATEDLLKTEEEDAKNAAEFFVEIKKLLDDATAKYTAAQRQRGKVVHELSMAKLAKDKAAQHLAQARELDNLRQSGGVKTDDVLARVSAVAANDRKSAEAMEMAADRIKTAAGNTSENLADEILAENAPAPAPRDPFARLNS